MCSDERNALPGYQAHSDIMAPVRMLAASALKAIGQPLTRNRSAPRRCVISPAAYELIARAGLTHARPAFGIERVKVGNRDVAVREEARRRDPVRHAAAFQEGHRAGAAARCCWWRRCRAISRRCCAAPCGPCCPSTTSTSPIGTTPATCRCAEGRFGFDEYVAHVIHFLEAIGPGAHVVAVCQPCVAALVAAAVMAEDGNSGAAAQHDPDGGTDRHRASIRPRSTSSPRAADRMVRAESDRRPCRRAIAGAGRRVYPGFMQLAAFMSMNLERHVKAHLDLYDNLAKGETSKAAADQGVLRRIFRGARSDRGVLSRDRAAGVPGTRAAARQARLSRRQGRSARDPPHRAVHRGGRARRHLRGRPDRWRRTIYARACALTCKRHHMQPGVGHYGVFSGQAWENQIYPIVKNVILQSD